MNVLIGSITGCCLIFLFSHLEKKRIEPSNKTKVFFFLYVIFCAYIMKPSESSILLWFGISLLLYSVLDDMTTKTLNIYLPILTSLLFLIFTEKPYFFLFSFLFFLIFLILTKITKEKWIGEGDIYLFLPLSFLVSFSLPESASFLFLAEKWIQALFLSSLVALVCILPIKMKKEETEFAFAPYLILGFILVYSNWTYLDYASVILLLLTVILSIIYGIFSIKKNRE